MHNFRQNIRKGDLCLGTWFSIPNTVILDILTNFDQFSYIVIDMEHSCIDEEKQQDFIRLIQNKGKKAIVRIPSNEEIFYKKALDFGADGIITPMVKTIEDIHKMLDFSFYPPVGKRGMGLMRANQYGYSFKNYLERLEKDLVLIAQIEHIDAINNLEEISNEDRIDAYLIGPYDLSSSIGEPNNYSHPDVKLALEKYRTVLSKKKKTMGYHIVHLDSKDFNEKIKENYTFIAYGVDFMFLNNAIEKSLDDIK